MNELKAYFVVYDGTNYTNWRYRMEAILDEKDLLKTIERELNEVTPSLSHLRVKEYKKLYKIARSVLIQHISDSQLDIIRDKKTPKEIWDTLARRKDNNGGGGNGGVGKKNIVNQLNLKKKLLLLKYNEAGNLETFFNTFDKIIKDLKSSGVKLEESEIICHLLLTMPKYFDTVVKKIESLSSDKATVSFVKEALIEELKKLKEVKEDGTEKGATSVKGEKNGKSESNARNRYRARANNHGRHRQKSDLKNDKIEDDEKLNVGSTTTNGTNETKDIDDDGEKTQVDQIQNEESHVENISNDTNTKVDETIIKLTKDVTDLNVNDDAAKDDTLKSEAIEVAA